MAVDNNKHAIWALLLSLPALVTTFQQQVAVLYNWMVTPNEIVGLHSRDYPQNDPPLFLSGLYLVLGSSYIAKAVLHGAGKFLLLGSLS